MRFTNKELLIFEPLPFPYSKELKDLKLDQSRPNLDIKNTNQSLYSILKQIRDEIIPTKLKNGNFLLFDRYINDILGIRGIKVDKFYPPENLHKLDRFITELKSEDIKELDGVIYYMLKDFSNKQAELFIRNGHGPVSRISQNEYDLINAVYALDRFDIRESFKYVTSSIVKMTDTGFINHLIRLCNIISYTAPNVELNGVNDIRSYLELNSSRDTSFSVISMVDALELNVFVVEVDILLIYLDALSDISPFETLRFVNRVKSSLVSSISYELVLKIVVLKIVIRAYKQRTLLSQLYIGKLVDEQKLQHVYDGLVHFYLIDNKLIEEDIIKALSSIYNGTVSKEEGEFRLRYPKYFNRLELSKGVRKVVFEVLERKKNNQINQSYIQ